MSQLTTQEAKQLVIQSGSKLTESDNQNYITTVDKNNTISSWLVIPSKKPKIDTKQVQTTIDVELTELKPNIPQNRTDFISKEQYDNLLAQTLELNTTINSLTNQVVSSSVQIEQLKTETETQINEKLSYQQTNLVLVNQLTSLSQTIDGFSQQISVALQKSIEESIFRTSLEAQNKGYEAQIQALITQADSLNAIITGLYAQLGASLTQKAVETEASSAAAGAQGDNVNEVVIVKQLSQPTSQNDVPKANSPQDFHLAVRNKSMWNKWLAGGDITFTNFNKVPVKVNIQVFYPKKGYWTGGADAWQVPNNETMQWFKFSESTFTLSPEQKDKKVKTIMTFDHPYTSWWFDNDSGTPGKKNSHSCFFPNGTIKVTVTNDSTGIKKEKVFSLTLASYHKNSWP
jgi:hypothetical protein